MPLVKLNLFETHQKVFKWKKKEKKKKNVQVLFLMCICSFALYNIFLCDWTLCRPAKSLKTRLKEKSIIDQSCLDVLPWPKNEPSWWCIMWYRRICGLISLRCIDAWSRVRSRFRSRIKLHDSSISQDSDFMHQQHGSFFVQGSMYFCQHGLLHMPDQSWTSSYVT